VFYELTLEVYAQLLWQSKSGPKEEAEDSS